jgi:hypothetical protein
LIWFVGELRTVNEVNMEPNGASIVRSLTQNITPYHKIKLTTASAAVRMWRPGGAVVGDGDGAAAVVRFGISVLDHSAMGDAANSADGVSPQMNGRAMSYLSDYERDQEPFHPRIMHTNC